MSDRTGTPGFPRGFDAHRREQRARLGAEMTPGERLRWLEETLLALRRWQGRARQPAPPPSIARDGEE